MPAQLRSTAPVCREWTTDATAVHLAALHGSGPRRLTIAVQGSGVEVRCAPELGVDKSYQLYGHTARVSAVGVVPPAGALRRIGLATASHDQTVR